MTIGCTRIVYYDIAPRAVSILRNDDMPMDDRPMDNLRWTTWD